MGIQMTLVSFFLYLNIEIVIFWLNSCFSSPKQLRLIFVSLNILHTHTDRHIKGLVLFVFFSLDCYTNILNSFLVLKSVVVVVP